MTITIAKKQRINNNIKIKDKRNGTMFKFKNCCSYMGVYKYLSSIHTWHSHGGGGGGTERKMEKKHQNLKRLYKVVFYLIINSNLVKLLYSRQG